MYNFFEEKTLEIANNIVNKKKEELNHLGVKVKIEDIRRINSNGLYSSEIEINFSDNKGIFDVLEFFVYYQNKPQFKFEEIEEWLEENVVDIIKKRM